MLDLNRIAEVLEKTADYLDAAESERAVAIQAEREKLAEVLHERYQEATGETLDAPTLSKIAGADVDLLSVFDRLIERGDGQDKQAELGAPSDKRDPLAIPQNKKEAAAVADERLLQWIMEP